MKDLTNKQQEILTFITNFIEDKGYPPTVREIGRACNLSSSASVQAQINNLVSKGYIKRDKTQSRAIRLVKDEFPKTVQIPHVGLVTAGNPIEAIENVSDYFPVPAHLVKHHDTLFMLTVSGDSMKNAGILDHDQIIVRKSNVADNNEIVVALTEDNEATVKRFFKEKGHYRLQPENDDYEPIILKEVQIIGKVIGVYREIH